MSNFSFFIGSDISKAVIDISYYQSGKIIYLGQYANTIEGFKQLLKDLKGKTDAPVNEWFFCFENTGVYSKPLFEWLTSQQISCREENALKISKSLGLRRGKNDKVDSKDICLYAFEKRDSIQASKLPNFLITKLRKILSRRDFLVRQRQSLEISLKEQKGFINPDLFDELDQGNSILINEYNRQIKLLEIAIQTLIQSDVQTAENDKLARTVVGVGPVTSAYIIAITQNYTSFKDPRKFACYCGVAPFANRSGKRIGKTKVSHIANKKMKSILSMCVSAAMVHDPELSKYYNRKLKEGKEKGIVLNALKNKIIQRVFAVVKRKTPYVKIMNYA